MPIVDTETFRTTAYDYIIVGAGTAGLALATRLSEDASATVGVIEAGGWHPELHGINIPAFAASIMGNPTYDWAFMSVPQKHSNNVPVFQPRGKVMGGSSTLNFLCMTRASAEEYDSFELLGNKGWNWKNLLHYFKKSETTLPAPPASDMGVCDPAFHGDSGPIKKSYSTWANSLRPHFFSTLEKLGVPTNPDAENGHNMGTTFIHASVDTRTGYRSQSARDYYEPASERPNLHVLTEARVTRILFRAAASGDDLTAMGVEFVKADQKYVKNAVKKEIILSAGCFLTPQLLELSGIGNKNILKQHGIGCLIDLPGVGENLRKERQPGYFPANFVIVLQDHMHVFSTYELKDDVETFDILSDPEEQIKHMDLFQKQEGLLTTLGVGPISFIPTKAFATPEQMKKWTEMAKIPQDGDGLPGREKVLELQRKWLVDANQSQGELILFPKYFPGHPAPPQPGVRYSSMPAILMHPFSRGSVHVVSNDPAQSPSIDPAYWKHPLDLEMVVALIKFIHKLYRTKPFSDFVKKRVIPEEGVEDDESLRDFAKNTLGSAYHPLGTAAMLPREDGGVVDGELRVYGTKNLRVVDLSVVPMELSCHTQATVYAIAEKAADVIKGA